MELPIEIWSLLLPSLVEPRGSSAEQRKTGVSGEASFVADDIGSG